MANLTETPTYTAGIYQLERTDAVDAGTGGNGVSNAQALALANRTAYLKAHVDALEASPKQFKGILAISGNTALTSADFDKIIFITDVASGIVNVTLPASGSGNNFRALTFYSESSYSVNISVSGSDTIGGASGPLVLTTQSAELVLNSANYIITRLTDYDQGTSPVITVGSGGSAPAFQNGWSASAPVLFRKDKGYVYFNGVAQQAGSSLGVIFTLPVGYRPSTVKQIRVTDISSGTERADILYIATNGDVYISQAATNPLVFLDGVFFYMSW